ncbi:MAG: chromosome segregation protein SMC [Deltaproteobacteria bacterium]|nr:chromosome segregation protein SMC [Deltaproteobacteria bacterium]
MKIKSMDIVGFKSFPERTRVIFSKGISAIVGPNGCGKSNIVDAFRWVMGEQSAKQLRGRQMDDVLFNGTNSHQPAGLAEVVLTFANGDSREYEHFKGLSEITVTRRLYRSGDSEYLINNLPCRLKDIIQLFMETGMGTKTYSIVEQGRIGALVDLRPEERRILIDEAAGITRYKAQKKEAERKIEVTEQNLVHIQTLMAETKRQLNSIARASKKAVRYRTLKAELKEIDLSLASVQLKDLERQQSILSEKRDELHSCLVSHLTNVEKMEVGLEGTRLSIVEQEKIIETKADLLYSLKNEFNTLCQEKDFIQNQIATTNSRQENLTIEVSRLKDQHRIRREELACIQEEMGQLEGELESQKSVQVESQSDFNKLDQTYELALAQRDRLKQELAEVRTRLGRVEELIIAHERMAQSQAQRREEITAAIEKHRSELEPLTEQIQELTQKIDGLTSFQEEIQKRLDSRREKLKTSQAELESLDQQTREVESDLTRVSSRLATLKDLQANFGWYSKAVQALMASPEMKAAGVIGPLAEQITIPAGYEMAWEAAFGERLQYILVRDQAAAISALDYLKAHKLGRCGFISLAGQGLGAETNLTRALLGEYELVDNIAEALALGPGHAILTRDGAYFGQDGLIVGGEPRDQEQGLLAHRHEIEKLTLEIKALEDAKKRLADLAQVWRHKVNESTDFLAGDERSYQEINTQLLEAEKSLSVLNVRCEEAESSLAALIQTLEAQEAKARQLTAEKDSAKREKENLEKVASDLSLELESTEEGLLYHAQELETAREKQQEVSLRINTLDGRIRTLKRDEVRTEEWIKETESGLEVKDNDFKILQAEVKRLLARKEEIHRSMEGFDDRLAKAQENVAFERGRLDNLRAELNTQENELRLERRRREEMNEQINKQDLDLQEVAFKKQNLLTRIEDEYHLNLANLPQELQLRPEPDFDIIEAQNHRDELRRKIEGLGEVNLTAISEEEALRERYDFYKEQYDDLVASIENLKESISRINRTCKIRFNNTFQAVDQKLREVFPILFDGGEAWLALTDETDPLDCGVEIHVHPPGKKLTVMSLLSGGEKALVALALIFSLYLIKPSPFCLLDEIDAPLDEANIDRFNRLLNKLGQTSQIILVTHNKRTMQMAGTLYGVTMEKPGVSKMVSVNLSEIEEKLEDDQMVQTI